MLDLLKILLQSGTRRKVFEIRETQDVFYISPGVIKYD